MEDLDNILLDQLHNAKRTHKLIKKLKKLFKDDKILLVVDLNNTKRISFFENMIKDKTLLDKKVKKKKRKESDLLSKNNPMMDAYRLVMFASLYGYKVTMNYVSGYLTLFKKKRD